MKELKITLIQMNCKKGLISENLKRIEEYIRFTRAEGARLIVFPEMSITGYINPDKYPSTVLSLESEPVRRIIELSGQYGAAVVAGFVEKNLSGKPFITQIAATDGRLQAVYRKIHVAEDETAWFDSGEKPISFICDGIRIGLAVCADIHHESLFAEYASEGAKLIIESAAPGLYGEQATRDWQSGYDWWQGVCRSKLGSYAKKYGVAIAVSTQAGRTEDEDFPGGGYLFAADGECIKETADWGEGALFTSIKL